MNHHAAGPRKRSASIACVLLCLMFLTDERFCPVSKVSAFSLSTTPSSRPRKPSPAVKMNRRERQHAMNSIWRHTNSEAKNPQEALRLLETLLNDERDKDSQILKIGAVFNVLKLCQRSSLNNASLDILERVYALLQNNSRLFDANMCSVVATCLSKNGRPDRAESLLFDNALQLSDCNLNQLRVSLNTALDGYAKKAKVSQAERLLSRMEEKGITPDAVTYTCIMKALVKSRQEDAPQKARELLERMEKNSVQPDAVTYSTVLRCFANKGLVKEVEELLERMNTPDKVALKYVEDAKYRSSRRHLNDFESMQRNTTQLLSAPVGSFDNESLLNAKNAIWFHINKNNNKKDGAEKALLLLARMLEEQVNDSSGTIRAVEFGMVFNILRACQQTSASTLADLEHVTSLLDRCGLLNGKLFTEVLVAMCKCDEDGPSRAETLLDQDIVSANSYHYCAILNGYAKRGNARRAEQLLRRMEDLDKDGRLQDGPNTFTMNCVLDALSNSSENKVVERAEAILSKMRQHEHTQPDFYTYTTMLHLYSKHIMGDKAEAILEEAVQLSNAGKLKSGPNTYSYRCVIDALAKSGEPEKAEKLLGTMRARNIVPNKFHYCGVLSGYAKEGRPLEAERLLGEMRDSCADEIGQVAYNCGMYAWAKSGEVDAPFRARALLDQMLESGIPPDIITYNCLLCACGNRAMAKESEQLLKQMHELHENGDLKAAPDTISYNYVLDALARNGDRVWTVLRAETLVNDMKELAKSGKADTMPNMITYKSLLRCYTNWNLPEDAERLLRHMEKHYERGQLDFRPDRLSYRLVIDSLEKSGENKTRAEELRKQVETLYGKQGWKQEKVIDVMDTMDALLEYMRD